MEWKKKGLVYKPPFDGSWKDNSALTPTPFLINDNVIRIFAGFRDLMGISRIGYVDVNSANPSEIINVSDKPVIDIGLEGMFDDNGVILGDVISVNNVVYLYYVGFQLVEKAKFLAYSGLALSNDNGNTFHRYKQTPILDREDEALYIRAIHSVIFEENKFKVWYAAGNGWEDISGKFYPQYDINYIESADGIHFSWKGKKCICNNIHNKEYRIGRPRVYRYENSYIMNFTYGTTDGKYIPGQATSMDGIKWIRNDADLGISLSVVNSWDSVHLCYPAIIKAKNKTYIFYNGNNMGYAGFGYAELKKG